jgi:hypothetical protein
MNSSPLPDTVRLTDTRPPPRGVAEFESAAAATPGTDVARRSNSVRNAAIAAGWFDAGTLAKER